VILPALPTGTHEVDATLYRNGEQTPYRQTHVEVKDTDATATPKPSAAP
jgi:hypothetical protein